MPGERGVAGWGHKSKSKGKVQKAKVKSSMPKNPYQKNMELLVCNALQRSRAA